MTDAGSLRVPGKWVLAGEHAVLRGHPALALPHPEAGLTLRWRLEDEGAASAKDRELLDSLVAELRGWATAEGVPATPCPSGRRWRLEVEADQLPQGAGLGSSAALCVALARWVLRANPEAEDPARLRRWATRLEDRFHGRSSGMDVAVVVAAVPILYRRRPEGAEPEVPDFGALPRFTFHDTGLRASTRDCVAQVEARRHADPTAGDATDARMGEAVARAVDGLLAHARGGGVAGVAAAMDLAQGCFEEWGLVPPAARAQRAELLARGASAVKLTGAGDGGFLVALWPGR